MSQSWFQRTPPRKHISWPPRDTLTGGKSVTWSALGTVGDVQDRLWQAPACVASFVVERADGSALAIVKGRPTECESFDAARLAVLVAHGYALESSAEITLRSAPTDADALALSDVPCGNGALRTAAPVTAGAPAAVRLPPEPSIPCGCHSRVGDTASCGRHAPMLPGEGGTR